MYLIIKNGRLIDPVTGKDEVRDIFIEDGRIRKINNSPKNKGNIRELDAKGKWIMPGFIDLHVHFRDPGFTEKEDMHSGSLAAAKGGFIAVCPMPNTYPVADSKEVVREIIDKEERVKIYPVAAMSRGLKGRELTDFHELKKAGAIALSDDGRPLESPTMMLEAMRRAKKEDMTIFAHEEDLSISPFENESEYLNIARDTLLAKKTKANLHICHVSTKESVSIIRMAKKEGVKITAETAPHYIAYTKEDRDGTGRRKMNPPLRSDEDKKEIIKGIVDGTIDAVATDHAPHTDKEKECSYEKALNGVSGLETSFAAINTFLVRKKIISPLKAAEIMSTNPGKILKINPPSIKDGEKANLVIIDPEKRWTVSRDNLVTRGKNSAFLLEELIGKPVMTIRDGEIIYEEKEGEI